MAKEKDPLLAPVRPPLQEEDMMGVYNKSIKQNQDTDGKGWENPGGPRPATVRRRPHNFHRESSLKPISGNLGQLSLFS